MLFASFLAAALANPTFLINGAGEARHRSHCSSEVAFLGWCAFSTTTHERGWLPAEDDAEPWQIVELGARYLVAGVGMKRFSGASIGQQSWAVERYRVEYGDDKASWTDAGTLCAVPTAGEGGSRRASRASAAHARSALAPAPSPSPP